MSDQETPDKKAGGLVFQSACFVFPRHILGINPVQFGNFLFRQTSQF